MYACELCHSIVLTKTPSTLLTIQTCKRTYPARSKANKLLDPKHPGKHRKIFTDDPGGTGLTILKEIRVCPKCAGMAIDQE